MHTDQPMHNALLDITNLDVVQAAFNESAVTDNIKVCHQSDEAICKLRIRERMPAVLHFNEKVESWVLGDGKNFAFEPIDSSNAIFSLRGIYPGADTNLTAVGASGLIYSFYIRIDSVSSEHVSDFVVRVRANPLLLSRQQQGDKHAEGASQVKEAAATASVSQDYLAQKPPVDATDFNFDFEIVNGDQALMPRRIFDDGIWTYFQYGEDEHLNKVNNLPVVYAVRDGYDMPVNARVEGEYLIAETVSDQWTIRRGEAYACVHKH